MLRVICWVYARFLFYPTLILNILLCKVLGVRNWYDRIDECVILGALPSRKDVSELERMGVRAVLNVCDEYAGPEEAYSANGIEHLRLPTIDYTSPSLSTVRQGVCFIEKCVSRGDLVYVHCKAGRGRSATIVLCWLVKAKKINPLEAMDFLLERRPHVNKKLDKRKVVKEFISKEL
ncbi:MAG: dual specificity protein phosphatase family protein [Deltaproteobacteria bacterium]|nr:dual specificity protein phosphatase family protein [Deltaproteobacteria bacterium]